MSGLKEGFYPLVQAQLKATPDEMDMYRTYTIAYPGTAPTALGTVNPGTVNGTFIITQSILDYPRNVLFSVLGPAGGAGGTAVITGKSFAGVTINETITIGSANGGGSAAGTLIFAQVTSGSYFPNGVNNTGTPRLGYAIGTAAGLVHLFGMPDRFGGTTDMKSINYLPGAGTALVQATPSSRMTIIGAGNARFTGTAVVANTDMYTFLYKPTFDNSSRGLQAGL